MNEYIQTNKRSLILLTGLFLLLAIVLYVMLNRPLAADLERQEKNIAEAKNDQETLTETLKVLNLQPDEVAFEDLMLEKVIPKERLLDEYILSLQQLELTTSSKIEQIHFVYDSQISDHEQEEDNEAVDATSTEEDLEASEVEENETKTDEEIEKAVKETADDEEMTLEPTFIFEKPEGLEAISVRVVAASPSYDEFIEFLKAIEQQERLSIVSQLRFDHPTEDDEYFADEPKEDITFEIELTTFYYED